MDSFTHWSLVGLFVIIFAAGAICAWLNARAERRRDRRYVRRVR